MTQEDEFKNAGKKMEVNAVKKRGGRALTQSKHGALWSGTGGRRFIDGINATAASMWCHDADPAIRDGLLSSHYMKCVTPQLACNQCT